MTMDRDELRRLHFINALFAHVTGQDLYLAHQIKSAIAFNLAELEAQEAAGPLAEPGYSAAFNAAPARVLPLGRLADAPFRDAPLRPRRGDDGAQAARALP